MNSDVLSLLACLFNVGAGLAILAYRSWSLGVADGLEAQRCVPPRFLFAALWIAGYAYGAQARLLEREARREREDAR